MKKVFVIAAVAASLIGLTSCNKDKLQCWEVTTKSKVLGAEISLTGYKWDSQNHLDVYIEEAKNQAKVAGATLEVTYKKASKYKNQVDCEAQNTAEWAF